MKIFFVRQERTKNTLKYKRPSFICNLSIIEKLILKNGKNGYKIKTNFVHAAKCRNVAIKFIATPQRQCTEPGEGKKDLLLVPRLFRIVFF